VDTKRSSLGQLQQETTAMSEERQPMFDFEFAKGKVKIITWFRILPDDQCVIEALLPGERKELTRFIKRRCKEREITSAHGEIWLKDTDAGIYRIFWWPGPADEGDPYDEPERDEAVQVTNQGPPPSLVSNPVPNCLKIQRRTVAFYTNVKDLDRRLEPRLRTRYPIKLRWRKQKAALTGMEMFL
jgi:hypothetical protein